MKKLAFVSFLALMSMRATSQMYISAGPDKCASPSATLTASANVTTFPTTTSYKVATLAYAPEAFDGTAVITQANYADNKWLSKVKIGFPFSYFGNTFNEVCIGVNGLVTFDLSKVNMEEKGIIEGRLPGVVNTTLPLPNYTIFAAYRSLSAQIIEGNIYTKTIGTAPCRSFVVSWVNLPLYTSYCYYNYEFQTCQLVLHERTNTIDVNIKKSLTCAQRNNGLGIIGIQGIQNNTSSNFAAAPDRNATMWNASNESWRFSPNGTTSQTQYSGPFTWTSSKGVVGTGSSITVSPTTCTTYTVTANNYQSCPTGSNSDEVNVCPKPDPEFSIRATLPYPESPFYNLSVTARVNTSAYRYAELGFYWDVVEVDNQYRIKPNTLVKNPTCWWYATITNDFKGYDFMTFYDDSNNSGYAFNGGDNGSCRNNNPGKFKTGSLYRITHATWTKECAWEQVSQTALFRAGKLTILRAETSHEDPLKAKEEFLGKTMVVYPNPSTGFFTVHLENSDLKDVYVYDLMGKVVYSTTNSTEQSFQIDLTRLPKGLYLLKLLSNNEVQMRKIISE